jgi:hypothetical protein
VDAASEYADVPTRALDRLSRSAREEAAALLWRSSGELDRLLLLRSLSRLL